MAARKEPQKKLVPRGPATDTLAVIDASGDPVLYECGHEGAPRFTVDVYGLRVPCNCDDPKLRARCPTCGLDWMRKTVIRCVLCGHPILPREPISAYIKEPWMDPARCTVVIPDRDPVVVAGCMDHECMPGAALYGYWLLTCVQVNNISMVSRVEMKNGAPRIVEIIH